jgi:hypothetical protein
MSVGLRERDWSQLRDSMAIEDLGVHVTLATCVLLKFFECPLIWVQEYLLQFLIQMWSPDLHCFMVWGEKIAFTTVEDIYFCIGILFRGTPLPTVPVLPRDVALVTVGRRFCSGANFMSGTVVSIGAMDAIAHRCIAAMIVRVHGSLAMQQISGGQLCVMERVLVGEHFAWGLTLHVRMVGQLDHCRSTDIGEFAFGSILVAWFLERVPMLRPRILLGAPGARESRLRWWSTVFLHHGGGESGHLFTTEVTQVWRQMSQVILQFPYAGVDFREDPDMVLPLGEVLDHRGMLMSFIYMFFEIA